MEISSLGLLRVREGERRRERIKADPPQYLPPPKSFEIAHLPQSPIDLLRHTGPRIGAGCAPCRHTSSGHLLQKCRSDVSNIH